MNFNERRGGRTFFGKNLTFMYKYSTFEIVGHIYSFREK